MQNLRRSALREALEAQQVCRRQLLLAPVALASACSYTSSVTSSGCLIIIVQSQSALRSIENCDMSGTHQSPSSGITR